MIFGIDLGTTNSLIGVGDVLISSLVSSSVDVNTKKQVARHTVGENIVSSYKTNMSMSKEGQLSIQCSAIILKELARVAERRYGEKVEEVAISVPAYFSTSQREAVYKSAEIAGLRVAALLNEPTAAALYVCRNVKDLVVVYDLGGGTFDVSVVDSRTGAYSVIATDGIVLGGDDLDQALVLEVCNVCMIPLRFRNKDGIKKLRAIMCKAKEEIQHTRQDVYCSFPEFGSVKDYLLTVERYKEIVHETFNRTFDMTKYVIATNVPACEHPKVVFVGGSTMDPFLKAMLSEELSLQEISTDINADLIVAKGVSLYAEMLKKGTASYTVEDVTKRLCIEDDSGRGLTIIDSNTIIPCRNEITVSNSKKGQILSLRLYQGDELLARSNDYIGTLEYDYGYPVEAGEGILAITVEVSSNGVITLSAVDVLYGDEFKQEITLTSR